MTPHERQERVEAVGRSEQPILVATDCLSEGINLQDYFTCVIHYDLSWNPTRHEQREGRVDRFGQKAKEVRAVMLYGENNPIDGAVLDVILRKAQAIKRELGIMVPMPDDEEKITQALMRTVLLKRGEHKQGTLDLFDEISEVRDFEIEWESAYEKAKQNRTIFAQRGLKPSEVLPEWEKSRQVLGSEEDVKRFVRRICSALNAPLDSNEDGTYRLYVKHFPETLRELLKAQGIEDEILIDFDYPAKPKTVHIHRTSTLVSTLADFTAESALQQNVDGWIARASIFFTDAVSTKTVLALARIRTRLTLLKKSSEHTILCEEALTLKVDEDIVPLSLEEQRALYGAEAVKNMPKAIQKRHLEQALELLRSKDEALNLLAEEYAQKLLEDHRRIRDASKAKGAYNITPVLPVDILSIVILVPAQKGM